MKLASILALGVALLPLDASAQTASRLLAASATSSAPGSAPITCLLDPKCEGSWVSGAADAGADEGIYLQFEQPIRAGYLMILSAGKNPKANAELRVYINGNTSAAQARGQVASDADGNQLLQLSGGSEIEIKSLFLKVESPFEADRKALPIRKILLYPAVSDPQAILKGEVAPIRPELPALIPAEVSATSILEPVSAYHPAHLFDSAYDIAWSTDGKKNDGKEESFTLNFRNPQTVAGMMVWNGYQRSAEHFKANGRVLEAEIQADGMVPFRIPLEDRMGAQEIAFPKNLPAVSKLRLTIKAIAPGKAYKDVLISELRLISDQGKLMLPQVELPKTMAPAPFRGMINRSYASILHQPIAGKLPEDFDLEFNLGIRCDNARIRLRDNGTFVVYKDFNYGKADSAAKPTSINAGILEGNWEPKGDKLRIFGKKYVSALQKSEYLQETSSGEPRVQIFQSEVEAKPYRSLTPEEKQKLFAFLWAKKQGPANRNQNLLWVLGATKWNGTDAYKKAQVEGAGFEALMRALDPILEELNPVYLSSSVLTDLFLPTDETQACWSSRS